MTRAIIIAVAALLALGLGVGGGLYAGHYFAPSPSSATEPVKPPAAAVADPEADLFYDMPETLAALHDETGNGLLLRLGVSVECPTQDDLALLQEYLPRVLDVFQVYLRTQELKDLRGAKNLERLREGLRTRIETAIAPGKVSRVLFRDIAVE
jgi:flagellar FliL protein